MPGQNTGVPINVGVVHLMVEPPEGQGSGDRLGQGADSIERLRCCLQKTVIIVSLGTGRLRACRSSRSAAMDIRKLWFAWLERVDQRRSVDTERMRAIGRVLVRLRSREKWLLDQQRAVMDDEQRADLADKVSVLRAQRAKGLRALREWRRDRRARLRDSRPGK